ncbi:chaperonin 10-like protein [Echria macrotheca]|uniref:Chaperonin 10-like protein n=1 Tax=Echria macrotheca TaxID=438768 RepID=A0AAJ0FEE9_9PEZI|nr:chaperonin 10-like protein [Echria macrotheca]
MSLSFLRRMSLPSRTSKQRQAQQEEIVVPDTQKVLLLRGVRQPYELTQDYPVPQIIGDREEVLVRTSAIGLNPIDWKSPDFGFAIPELPYISGRECAGEIVQTGTKSRLRRGERVLVISTDYRDLRKATYQEYVVASSFNVVRLPQTLTFESGSTLGVAFVAAALALGVCMGVDFSGVLNGPDLLGLVRQSSSQQQIADDIRDECLNGIGKDERAVRGDWIVVWGGSSTSANLTVQLARLVGLKTAVVVDSAKHGVRIAGRADLVVDSHDPARAVDIIRANLGEKVRFGIDTRGRESAASLLLALGPAKRNPRQVTIQGEGSPPPSPPATPLDSDTDTETETRRSAHLVGLAGLPKQAPKGTMLHAVPFKLFHEVPAVGAALSEWLERLLEKGMVVSPEIIDVEEGLGSVNQGLDRMRRGEISGGKLVVRV